MLTLCHQGLSTGTPYLTLAWLTPDSKETARLTVVKTLVLCSRPQVGLCLSPGPLSEVACSQSLGPEEASSVSVE